MVKQVYVDNAPRTAVGGMSNFTQQHRECVAHVEHLFSKRLPLLSFWQEVAEQFYPERADFTYLRSIGEGFADHLTTSFPLLIRRDLGNSISSFLRPEGERWMHMTTNREDQVDNAGRAWLEAKTKVLYRAMSDPAARFTRATKEADHDFAAFGQAVVSLEVNRAQSSLLYRTWHLRDVVWCEQYDGSIGKRARKWKPTALELKRIFGEANLHPQVARAVNSGNSADMFREINCMHIVVPTAEYDSGKKYRMPFLSIYIDMENKHVMEEKESATGIYIIPRWQTVSGSQYAHSPATVAALPDARLLQAINFTLLKAGEKAVDPPMIATEEMIRSPIDIQPGMVTWVDSDYDERTGEVLRPIPMDTKGIPLGFEMQDQIKQTILSAFYIDKMQLPPSTVEMTAFEVSQRLQEYIRKALPLFGPIQQEYNAPLCEDTFTLLYMNGAFGPMDQIPDSLKGQDVRFRFESPLIEAADQQLVQTFQDTANILAMAAQIDPGAPDILDAQVALRDTLRGRQVPAMWLRSEEDTAKLSAQKQQQQQQMQQAQMAEQVGNAAESMGNAKQALQPQQKAS